MNARTLTVATTFSLAFALHAGTWHVDADSAAAEPTGSPDAPYRTIQEAVNAAEASGDAELTVRVAPGTYDSGETADSLGAKNRVVIKKKMTLESTGTREDTFIVGALDASGAYGLGNGSVRGVCADGAAAAGTVVRGFTFRSCSAAKSNDKAKPEGHGGAVCFTKDSCDVYVKDCAAVDCAAYYGGGFRGVVAIRSLVKGCHNNNAGSRGSALYGCKAYCCVFDSCGSTETYNEYILQGVGPYVNCTAVGNSGSLLRTSPSQKAYNLLATLATRQEFDNTNKGGAYVICEYTGGKAGINPVLQFASSSSDYFQLLASPLTGDYRIVKGGKAENFADPQYCRLDWIPEADRGIDFLGNAFDVSGAAETIHCGAVQLAVKIVGGRVVVPRTLPTTATAAVTLMMYTQAETWPTQVWIPVAEDVFAVSFDGDAPARFGSAKGGFWQTLPQTSSTTLTPSFIPATARFAVGEGKAYATIQEAVDAASDAEDAYTLIDVEPGEYGPVEINAKNVFIRSMGGKAVTAIKGVRDTAVDEENEGCGPNARRCVTVTADTRLVAVMGFTLRDGATAIATDDKQNDGAAGAYSAKYASSDYRTNSQLLDCDIVDCSGFNAAAVWGGWIQRCRISNCVNAKIEGADSIVRGAILSSCVLRENRQKGNQLIANNTVANNCTIIARYQGEPKTVASITSYIQGTVVWGGEFDKATPTVGSVFFGSVGEIKVTSGFVTGNPYVANPANGPFALLAGSSAIGQWDASKKASSELAAPWQNMVGDFDENPMEVTDGKVTAGAFQTRYEPKDVYVDAAQADDGGDGLTAETAKRTLAGAMAIAGCGDTVHVAAGTYDEGAMAQMLSVVGGDSFRVDARVAVHDKVTLVGAGADVTTIRGGYAEEGEGELVRGVLLGDGATLRGISVTGGLAVTNTSTVVDNAIGAGVLGPASSTVEDCVISGNYASTRAGAVGGTFRRCTIRENWSLKGTASAGSMKTIENCLFTGNRGSSILADYALIANCTFLYDNRQVGGNRITGFGSYAEGAAICNSALILSPTQDTDVPDLVNCLLPKISYDTWHWKPQGVTENCILSETKFTDTEWDGVPAADYLGLDYGSNAKAPDGTDLVGRQRIQNAVVDIGAYEFDWMPTYSAKFSNRRRADVVATSGDLRAVEGGLAMNGESALVAIVTAAGEGKPLAVKAAVASGELSVRVNGVEVGTLTPSEPLLGLGELKANDKVEILLAEAGSAVVAGLRSMLGTSVILR